MVALEIVAFLGLLAWIGLLLDRSRRWPFDLDLQTLVAKEKGSDYEGSVAVLVPARNEAETLPRTLPSLLRQENVTLEIFVIDDASTDGTTEVVECCARGSVSPHRLTVIPAPPGKVTGSGKIRALEAGLRALSLSRAESPSTLPRWLLLTDADIFHRADSVRDLVSLASGIGGSRGFDLVSIMARLHAEHRWERLLIPAFVYFFQILYPFRRVQKESSRVAAAAGGCILLNSDMLLRAGGFTALRNELIDDVALAGRVQAAGGRLFLGLDSGIRSIRSYITLSALWRTISRTAFTQLRYSPWLLALTLLALLIVVVAPPLIVAFGLISILSGCCQGGDTLTRAVIWSAVAWCIATISFIPSVRHQRVSSMWAVTLPLAGLIYALMTADSALRYWLGHGTRWRGRKIT